MERSSQSISQVNDGNNMDDHIFLSSGSPTTSFRAYHQGGVVQRSIL
jgi:hypothetical protein